MEEFEARRAIAKRAHDGLVRTHAERFIKHRETLDDVELPGKFWWTEGGNALEQNWIAGDFSTWIDRNYQWKAYGVRFLASDIARMLPPSSPDHSPSAIFLPSAKIFSQLLAQCGDEQMGASTILTWVRTEELPSKARTFQVAFEGGPIVTERDKILSADDWGRIRDLEPNALRTGIVTSRGWDPNERETATIRLTGLHFDQAAFETLRFTLAPVQLLNHATSVSPRTGRKQGRPAAEWWDDLLIEMFRRLWEENWHPRTQAELVDAMHEWLALNPGDDLAHPREAADSTLKLRAKKLLDALDLGAR